MRVLLLQGSEGKEDVDWRVECSVTSLFSSFFPLFLFPVLFTFDRSDAFVLTFLFLLLLKVIVIYNFREIVLGSHKVSTEFLYFSQLVFFKIFLAISPNYYDFVILRHNFSFELSVFFPQYHWPVYRNISKHSWPEQPCVLHAYRFLPLLFHIYLTCAILSLSVVIFFFTFRILMIFQ